MSSDTLVAIEKKTVDAITENLIQGRLLKPGKFFSTRVCTKKVVVKIDMRALKQYKRMKKLGLRLEGNMFVQAREVLTFMPVPH